MAHPCNHKVTGWDQQDLTFAKCSEKVCYQADGKNLSQSQQISLNIPPSNRYLLCKSHKPKSNRRVMLACCSMLNARLQRSPALAQHWTLESSMSPTDQEPHAVFFTSAFPRQEKPDPYSGNPVHSTKNRYQTSDQTGLNCRSAGQHCHCIASGCQLLTASKQPAQSIVDLLTWVICITAAFKA